MGFRLLRLILLIYINTYVKIYISFIWGDWIYCSDGFIDLFSFQTLSNAVKVHPGAVKVFPGGVAFSPKVGIPPPLASSGN